MKKPMRIDVTFVFDNIDIIIYVKFYLNFGVSKPLLLLKLYLIIFIHFNYVSIKISKLNFSLYYILISDLMQ